MIEVKNKQGAITAKQSYRLKEIYRALSLPKPDLKGMTRQQAAELIDGLIRENPSASV